jgi:N-acetylglucosaminyldiphosphoundecaprenol N-acetyl-beta-D-mannosaminyltransferase
MHKDSICTIIRSVVDCTNYEKAVQKIVRWAGQHESRIVCAANVHMVMEAFDSPDFQRTVNTADLVTPDGVPLVWAMRLQGVSNQERVYGPTLTLHVCEAAATLGIPIALYGGTEESLSDFCSYLYKRFPDISIVCKIAPPFRKPTEDEDIEYTQQLIDSGARIVFVGIGCPKQEEWMAAHKGIVPAVMIGVGAAFDFHSGRVKQAPVLLQKIGMEWFFRLCMEPGRLWKRYLKHNPRFVILLALQILSNRLGHSKST